MNRSCGVWVSCCVPCSFGVNKLSLKRGDFGAGGRGWGWDVISKRANGGAGITIQAEQVLGEGFTVP